MTGRCVCEPAYHAAEDEARTEIIEKSGMKYIEPKFVSSGILIGENQKNTADDVNDVRRHIGELKAEGRAKWHGFRGRG